MELESNSHYKIVIVVCKLYSLGFLKHSMVLKTIQFVIKTGTRLPSILCLQGVLLVPALINPPPLSPSPPYSSGTNWHVIFCLGRYKQTNSKIISKQMVS